MSRKAQSALGSTEAEKKVFIKGFIAGATIILDTMDTQVKEMRESLHRILVEGEKNNDN